ncbi:MAG: hypothetical protein KDE59_16285, partial [Anaerolineales bacterium]|nr:hypothetical protein [Anaerolineales bacterium]
TQAELQEQFAFLIAIRDRLSECHEAINRIRVLRQQVAGWLGRGDAALSESGQAVTAKLAEIEEALINREGIERYMFYETKLSGKLAGMPILVANADFKPTDQAREVFADLEQRLGAQLARLERVVSDDIGQFNQLVQASGLLPVAAD